MKDNLSCLVVTDIDGTLMDHNYDLGPALETIEWLKINKVPLIPCTSKTAAEVRVLRKDIAIKDPFIVENGGAIYGTNELNDNEWEIILGRSYDELRPLLDRLSEEISYPLRALNDLTDQEINELTGLEGDSIMLAREREWSVPFLNPPLDLLDLIKKITIKHKTNVLQGNRMSHLLSIDSHKGKALISLKENYYNKNVKVIALGDSPNDLPLLKASDIPIVVPGINGPNQIFQKYINSGEFLLAPKPNAYGWSIIVKEQVSNLLLNEFL